jgi:hypothetical protein
MNSRTAKRKKAAGGIILQQPQMDRAATLRLAEESTIDADSLQQKMKEAATRFVELSQSISNWIEDSETSAPIKELIKTYKRQYARVFFHYLYRTPVAVMFRLGSEWIKLTEEKVAEATTKVCPDVIAGRLPATTQAVFLLSNAKTYCKDHGKVSWALPRISKREGGAL